MTSPLTATLAQLEDEKSLIEFVVRERKALAQRWTPRQGGRRWIQEHVTLMDAVLRRLFALSEHRTATENGTSAAGVGVAIVATGGYGQRLLAPGSDLDITFLAARDDDPPILRAMFRLVMDVLMAGARIKVGYAYRTLADIEAATLDHHSQTALLDSRLICGDGNLFARFDQAFHKNLQIAAFLFNKEEEQERRRAKFGPSVFVAEPDIKSGPGGMRDLQTAAWMARVRFHRSGEALWRDLVRRKVITKDDLHALVEAREFLLSTRCALHLAAGERRDLLSRPRQEEVAHRLGFSGPDAVGAFLQRYYRGAADIARLSDKVMYRCLEAPIPLGQDSGLSCVRRRVTLAENNRAEADPLWPMRALEFSQAHGLELALATDEALARYLETDPFRNDALRREAGRAFLGLLSRPGDVVATLERMRRTGLLAALLPELASCMGVVPGDPTHTLTVGEHSLAVLGNILHLRDGVHADDPRLGPYRAALSALDAPLPLYLAALLHDIGKQWPCLRNGQRSSHEETGAERIPEIGERLGWPPDVTETTRFLVRWHLVLAEISRLRDLGQPETIREAARAVGDGERLRMLYVLTYADTSAVGPGVFSDMNARLLEELFLRTEAQLARAQDVTPPPDAGMRDDPLASVRERLRRRLATQRVTPTGAADSEAIREHIEALPAAYLLNTPLETMALHLAMVERLYAGESVVLDMRAAAPDAAQTVITVVTRDDPAPGLLAKLTGALVASDVNLHTAQVFTREQPRGEGIVIDTLVVDHKGRALGVDKRNAVDEAIRLVLRGEKTVAELLAQRRRPLNPQQPIRSVRVETAASGEYTVVDVEAPDEPGVVYRLASLLTGQGWNIHAARVSAWSGNARAAFYVTDAAGNALEPEVVSQRLTANSARDLLMSPL